jgi:hypothetical protein
LGGLQTSSPIGRAASGYNYVHRNPYQPLEHLNNDFGTEKFQISYHKGNLFDLCETSSIVHCVAEDFLMLKGFAEQVRERFGHITYLKGLVKSTGEVATQRIDECRYVFHLVTKKNSRDLPRFCDIEHSLKELRKLCVDLGVKKLAMPRNASGLDHVPWKYTQRLIRQIFEASGITIDVFSLPYSSPQKTRQSPIKEKIRELGDSATSSLIERDRGDAREQCSNTNLQRCSNTSSRRTPVTRPDGPQRGSNTSPRSTPVTRPDLGANSLNQLQPRRLFNDAIATSADDPRGDDSPQDQIFGVDKPPLSGERNHCVASSGLSSVVLDHSLSNRYTPVQTTPTPPQHAPLQVSRDIPTINRRSSRIEAQSKSQSHTQQAPRTTRTSGKVNNGAQNRTMGEKKKLNFQNPKQKKSII